VPGALTVSTVLRLELVTGLTVTRVKSIWLFFTRSML